MGRPINKKSFGLATVAGNQIVVNGVKFADATTATNAYILKQTGSASYIVQDTALTHAAEIVDMVNATSTGALAASQCFITATPYGGSARPCEKISQYRLSLYESDGTIGDYSWSNVPATGLGQANLIAGTGAVGAIISIAISNAGRGYFAVPTVTFTGGGTGATATATLTDGSVTAITITSPGYNYTTGGMTLTAPPASVTATATGTSTLGVVDSVVTVTEAGGFYVVAPTVTVVGGNSDATAHAVVTDGEVTSIVIDDAGTGYDPVVVFTIAAPLSAVTALASAGISV